MKSEAAENVKSSCIHFLQQMGFVSSADCAISSPHSALSVYLMLTVKVD